MDQATLARDDARQPKSAISGQESFQGTERRYLARLATKHSCTIQVDAPPALMVSEMKTRWPFEPGAEPEARAILSRMENIIRPLTENIHPAAQLRLVINISQYPEVKLPFPDAPAIYATFDATHGVVRHRVTAVNEMQHDAWIEEIPLGLTLVCQPVETVSNPITQDLGQGGNLFATTDLELNARAQWRAEHFKDVLVPMMPFYSQPVTEPYKKTEIPETSGAESETAAEETAEAASEAALIEETQLREDRRQEANRLAEEAFRKRDEEAARAIKERETSGMLEAAIRKLETAIGWAERDIGLVRAEQDLSPELGAVRQAQMELKGLLHQGTGEQHLRAEGLLQRAEIVGDLAERPEFGPVPEANAEYGGTTDNLQTTREVESEIVAEGVSQGDVALTGEPAEAERIAETMPETATDILPEAPEKGPFAEGAIEGANELGTTAEGSARLSEAAAEITGEPARPEAATAEATPERALAVEAPQGETALAETGGTPERAETLSGAAGEVTAREPAGAQAEARAEAEPAAAQAEARTGTELAREPAEAVSATEVPASAEGRVETAREAGTEPARTGAEGESGNPPAEARENGEGAIGASGKAPAGTETQYEPAETHAPEVPEIGEEPSALGDQAEEKMKEEIQKEMERPIGEERDEEKEQSSGLEHAADTSHAAETVHYDTSESFGHEEVAQTEPISGSEHQAVAETEHAADPTQSHTAHAEDTTDQGDGGQDLHALHQAHEVTEALQGGGTVVHHPLATNARATPAAHLPAGRAPVPSASHATEAGHLAGHAAPSARSAQKSPRVRAVAARNAATGKSVAAPAKAQVAAARNAPARAAKRAPVKSVVKAKAAKIRPTTANPFAPVKKIAPPRASLARKLAPAPTRTGLGTKIVAAVKGLRQPVSAKAGKGPTAKAPATRGTRQRKAVSLRAQQRPASRAPSNQKPEASQLHRPLGPTEPGARAAPKPEPEPE